MPTFADVASLIPTLCGQLVDGDDAECAQASMMLMTDADIVKVLHETATLAQRVEQIQVAAAGVIAVRSKRERGHTGLSASRGHRSAAAFVQDITGSTKADANRKVRVGEALLDDQPASGGVPGLGADQPQEDRGSPPGDPHLAPSPWFQVLRHALQDGRLTSSQFDAIRRGLGEPPLSDSDLEHSSVLDHSTVQELEDARAAWAQAAERLVDEVSERTVEELWQQARTIRDMLDPEGAEARFLERFEKRSFRTYRDQDGQKRASMILEDEGDLLLETILAAALRPRRGGPRFVDPDEREQAQSLADDVRTNDQLAYDLIMDLVRAGALADAKTVFVTRQAGVRLVQTVDADGNTAPVAHSEDHVISFPRPVVDQHICDSGFVPVTVDTSGNPLNLGREQRLFTSQQRIALAIRDGGCRWRGCDRPASYCEAHHINAFSQGGRTDIDEGILLCRYHHMTLHHGGWRITRQDKEDFILHDSSGQEHAMRPRTVLSYAFGGIDPPPKRFRQVG